MSTRLPSLLLAAATVVGSYVVLVVGDLVPRFFQVTFKLRAEEVAAFMSPPTRFATDSSWVFVVAALMALAVALLLLRLHPEGVVRVTVATLCVQAVIVWMAFFCYCYDGFTGLMSLRHEPEFDPAQFLRFEQGVFPATLICTLIPLVACFLRRSPSSARAEQADAHEPPPGAGGGIRWVREGGGR